jgi:hypothetical protein
VAAGAAFRAGRTRFGPQAIAALAGRPALADVARYEEALAVQPRAHAELREDLFALAPDAAGTPPDDAALVRMNPSLTRLDLGHDAHAFAAGRPLEKRPSVVFLGARGFLVRVVRPPG